MSRRRLLGLAVPLVLIGVAAAIWFIVARRDADFVAVGAKTKGVRENFAKLEMMIDPAEFRNCRTVQEALRRLNEFTDEQPPLENHRIWRIWFERIRADREAFTQENKNRLDSPFQLPDAIQPMPLKQFLRMTLAQTGVPDVNFIVGAHSIEATTAKRAQEERARYLDSVSPYDRMHAFWKEMTGVVDDDPADVLLLNLDVW